MKKLIYVLIAVFALTSCREGACRDFLFVPPLARFVLPSGVFFYECFARIYGKYIG